MRLVSELGVRDRPPSRFRFPMSAQWTARGTCLIVDRGRPRNRAVELARDGSVVWSRESAPRMNWAHRLDDVRVLVSRDDLLVLCHGDDPADERVVARLPGVFAPDGGDCAHGLVALGSDAGIDVVTLAGDHVRRIPCAAHRFTNPTGVQLLPGGGLLVADSWSSRVVELDPDGEPVRRYGRRRSEGSAPDCVTAPRSACRLADGRVVVADTLAHRLVVFDPDGSGARVLPAPPGGLFAPSHVRPAGHGLLLVSDTGNRRVLLLAIDDGAPVWHAGPLAVPRRTLTFPRAAEPTPRGTVVVADAFAQRVVELAADGTELREHRDGLVLPRAATPGPGGSLVVADGVNGRVVVVGADGAVTREVSKVRLGGRRVALEDPHHAVVTPHGLLVVDSDLPGVLLLDDDDTVTRCWGGPGSALLADPHHALFAADGSLVVADSGHGRVVALDAHARVVREVARGLRYPRAVRPAPGGGLLIADTDHSRVVTVGRRGEVTPVVGPVVPVSDDMADSTPAELRTVRSVAFDRDGRLLVTDFWNSRIAVFA